ncbi:restriction endonuclease subunit S [Bacteroides caecigallinarum]|nr:restriction endonuclease subunit S [Bacteroides caecigallinarum]
MNRVKFGDIVKDVKVNVDRMNNPYEYYVAGDHMDSEDLTIHRKGRFATDDVGPAFVRIFKPGQILYGSRRTYLKKVAVADFSGICANTTFVFESKDHSIFDQRLLPFIMLSDSFTSWSISKSKGSTNPYVLFSDLADYEFDLPSLEEQKVLADKLWAAYRLKEGYKKLLCVTDEMVKSQFIEMLFKKPITGKIGDLVDKKIFSVKKIHSMNDIIEYIDISSVERSNHSIVETTSYVVSNAPSRAQQCVRLDDILVSTVRPINRNIAVVNSDKNNLVASTGFCVLRPKLAFKEYLLAIVQSDKYTEAMIDKASGGLYPAVNNGDVLNYGIYIPDEEFAKKFSLIYQQADKSKFELKQCIENIDKVIKSLING